MTAQLRLTPLMRRQLTRRAALMIGESLAHFPELDGQQITVGVTRKHLGSATVVYRKRKITRLIIRLRVRKVTYQTIGHELTHLVQGLVHGDRSATKTDPARIPTGEKQCDIWTLARHPLFCDDAPTYIKMPRIMRENWLDYADSVRALCVTAIEKRATQRQYIRWLEEEIRKLPRAARPKKSAGWIQLLLGL
jgi:hypothetical protein